MSERIIRLVIKFMPYGVRRAIVLEEFARTPRDWHNSGGITAEELLRNMAQIRGKKNE